MKKIMLLMLLIAAGCGEPPQHGDSCVASDGRSGVTGDSGSCMVCSIGDPVINPSGSCSSEVNGVYCCTGGISGGSSGGAYCSVGSCYSYIERICCPRSAPYACNGRCYSYSGGGGCSSYRTSCY